ncbi:uncharacterized protein LY79DRAFT_558509 [Colletotrichum navitas]|uniref:Uncharacterized protein n=1 Tax=Colletotrichum navitas TaxID=681940 RepID=A0AAD8V407_9PEZI|nr:uncharacterized protein LY79DRAFT_558509 [Colletotrichum navitas]KAK1585415.1 hypothetical protein LY79DRAFT_558509 [Colletotrichum navitas]
MPFRVLRTLRVLLNSRDFLASTSIKPGQSYKVLLCYRAVYETQTKIRLVWPQATFLPPKFRLCSVPQCYRKRRAPIGRDHHLGGHTDIHLANHHSPDMSRAVSLIQPRGGWWHVHDSVITANVIIVHCKAHHGSHEMQLCRVDVVTTLLQSTSPDQTIPRLSFIRCGIGVSPAFFFSSLNSLDADANLHASFGIMWYHGYLKKKIPKEINPKWSDKSDPK